MPIPYQQSGNKSLDQVQRRTQVEVRKIQSQLANLPAGVRVVAKDLSVPLSPSTVEVVLPGPIVAWFVVNNRNGAVIAEVSRTSGKLSLTATSAPCVADIAVF